MEGKTEETDLVLAILQHYPSDTAMYPVLKEVVSRFSTDTNKMDMVGTAIDSTGVRSGELGVAEAWRESKKALKAWLTDDRQSVRDFAEKHIAQLDRMVASEHRHNEADKAMRRMEYDGT